MLARPTLLAALGIVVGCAGGSPDDGARTTSAELTEVPAEYLPSVLEGLRWFDWLKTNFPDDYTTSSPSEVDARPWPDGFDARTDPIFAHNEIELAGVSPKEVLAILASGRSEEIYVNSSSATDCATGEDVTLTLGREYCWTTFGTVQRMKIVELAEQPDEAVIAWQGGSMGVEVYHRWIMRRVGDKTRVITEELERGILPRIPFYRNRMNPSLHAGHQLWLHGLRERVAE